MDELLKIDKTFNEGMFITKANNIFIMLHHSVMMDDLNRVKHFLSDEVFQIYEKKQAKLNQDNVRQMYDELNVKSTMIKGVNIRENYAIIKVDIVSRYMDYLVDKDTNKFISGYNDHRIEKLNHLEFTKYLNKNYSGIDKKCPGCGANIDVNNSGKCSYCGTIFNAKDYDWILTSIKVED
jgi:predicted lipid-binding transport protein (Tim44 family)